MKIAIIGYGKMGRLIESIALERGHEISCIIDRDNVGDFDTEAFRNSDVAIEFSTPGTAQANVERCFSAGIPVVCGTTGWTDALAEMKRQCEEGRGTMIWASNFSIGVNVFMAVNRKLAALLGPFPEYMPSLAETHHIHKLDHPSGTAITLAEGIIGSNPRIKEWIEPDAGNIAEDDLVVSHERRGEVPGIHTIRWDSESDEIILTHSAKSRRGFALGAVLAAEWLPSRRGWHTVGEVLGLEQGAVTLNPEP